MLRSICTAAQSLQQACKAPLRQAHTYARQNRGLYGGTQIQYGNNVPDSKTKTRRTWLPNVHRHSLRSDLLNKHISIRVQTGVLRTIKKYGGLDAFLLSESKQLVRNLGNRGVLLRNTMKNIKLDKARRACVPKVVKRAVRSATATASTATQPEQPQQD